MADADVDSVVAVPAPPDPRSVPLPEGPDVTATADGPAPPDAAPAEQPWSARRAVPSRSALSSRVAGPGRRPSIAGRLIGPTGFVLVGLTFLLPFATVSCTAQNKQLDYAYTGVDLVVKRRPAVDPKTYAYAQADGLGPRDLDTQFRHTVHQIAVQWPVVAAFGVVLLGVLCVLIGRSRVRTGLCMTWAITGAVALIAADYLAERAIYRRFAVDTKALMAPAPASSYLAVRPGYGFWLALGLLMLLFVGEGLHLARLVRPPAPPPPTG